MVFLWAPRRAQGQTLDPPRDWSLGAGIGIGFVSRFGLRTGQGLTCRDGRLMRRLALVRRRDRIPSATIREFERALLKRRNP